MEEMHYPDAPIIEAIIDIRTQPSVEITEAVFEQFAESLKAEYPQSLWLYSHELNFDVSHPEQIEAKGGRVGIRIASGDGKRLAVINKEGIAFSLLAPYSRWTEFEQSAHSVWDAYIAVIKPQNFSRVALRYVNLFRFAREDVSLPRYFTIYPQIEALHSQFSQHQLRVRVELEPSIAAIVTQTQLPSSDDVQILLDLDVFIESGLPSTAEAIWKCLLPLRDHKNFLFRQCLTYEGERRIRQ